MEPILIFLGSLFTFGCGFYFGYIFGYHNLKVEKLLESLSDFKKSVEQKFTPRQKLVILNSKDELPPIEEE